MLAFTGHGVAEAMPVLMGHGGEEFSPKQIQGQITCYSSSVYLEAIDMVGLLCLGCHRHNRKSAFGRPLKNGFLCSEAIHIISFLFYEAIDIIAFLYLRSHRHDRNFVFWKSYPLGRPVAIYTDLLTHNSICL